MRTCSDLKVLFESIKEPFPAAFALYLNYCHRYRKYAAIGSMPTAVNICPPNFVLMWQPSKHISGLHPLKNPLAASNEMYNVWK